MQAFVDSCLIFIIYKTLLGKYILKHTKLYMHWWICIDEKFQTKASCEVAHSSLRCGIPSPTTIPIIPILAGMVNICLSVWERLNHLIV